MPVTRPRKRASWRAIIAVAVVHFMIGFVLISGLHVTIVREVRETLNTFEPREITAEGEDRAESEVAPDPEEEGAAAPPDLRQEASPVAAPEREVQLPTSNRNRAAIETNDGFANDQGAAEQEGPGSGAGGAGDGTGSGRGGDGSGGGSAIVSRARRIAGDITRRDYPRNASRARIEGTVNARIDVDANGNVTGCSIARSSGSAELDATTCRLVRERFRYEPARNARGDAVPDVAGREQRWWLGRD